MNGAWHVARPDGYRLVISEPDRSRPGVWKTKITAYAHDALLTLATIDVLSLRDREAFTIAASSANGQAPVMWDEFLQQAYCVIEQATIETPADSTRAPVARALLIQGHTIQPEDITYVWPPYIPRKMATMLDGDPGVGKTGLACLIAAHVTRGWAMPDQTGKPTLAPDGAGNVLMVAMEDNLAAVIVQRLNACGADLTRITFLNECTDEDGNPRPFTLTDLQLLAEYMAQVHPRLVYIDAIQAVLGAKADIHRANVVTALLAPLKKLAEEYDCAVLCSRHPAKPGQNVAKVLYRGMGSQAFVGTVRSGLFVEEHPSDWTKSLLVHYKANTGKPGNTQIFSKAEGRFEWDRASRITHRALAGDGSPGPLPQQKLRAALWLETRLGNERLPASVLLKEAEELEDYSPKVMRAACDCLGVTKTQVLGDFLWSLPPLSPLSSSTRVSGVSSTSGGSGGTGVDLPLQEQTDFSTCTYPDNTQASQVYQVHHVHQDTPVPPVSSQEDGLPGNLSPFEGTHAVDDAPWPLPPDVCEHEHVDDLNVCNDCGELLPPSEDHP
jgi:hypothetical protein